MAVSKKFRRLGIASRLMIEALSRCGETAFLEVRESNKPAIELYKSLGFRKNRRKERLLRLSRGGRRCHVKRIDGDLDEDTRN